MKLFFVGGITKATEDSSPAFAQAAAELGYISAERGHTVLVGSESQSTLDYHVMVGVTRYAQEHPTTEVAVEVHHADKEIEPFTSKPLPRNIVRTAIRYERLPTGMSSHLFSHLGGLTASDLMIGMGGGEGTYRIGSVAPLLNKPMLALRQFGGSASLLYEKLKYAYASDPRTSDFSFCLTESWKEQDTARKIVGFAERFPNNLSVASPQVASSHTYFMSYS